MISKLAIAAYMTLISLAYLAFIGYVHYAHGMIDLGVRFIALLLTVCYAFAMFGFHDLYKKVKK